MIKISEEDLGIIKDIDVMKLNTDQIYKLHIYMTGYSDYIDEQNQIRKKLGLPLLEYENSIEEFKSHPMIDTSNTNRGNYYGKCM